MWLTLLLAAGGAAAAGIGPTRPAHAPALDSGLVYRGSLAPRPAAHLRTAGWCGTDAVAEDRTPDATAGRQVHVIYAFPADGPDRFAALAPGIAADAAAIDAWWRRQDPARTVRFDLYPFPGCAAGFGQLDISRVQLDQPGSAYEASSTRGDRLVTELGSRFADPYKKYVVYYDGPVDDAHLCGESSLNPDEGGRDADALVYAQACLPDIGAGNVTASVAAHELAHNLGAVPPSGPPHACPGDSAHVCDDENDLLYPFTHGQGLNALVLDSGRDDYYAHSGSWLDLQDSPWLAHLDTPALGLTVVLVGSGTGTVTSSVPGVSCPPACKTTWDQGSEVELRALPAEGTRFVGWSGACTADPCTVTMSSAQTVTARFAEQVQVAVRVKRAGKATGRVRSVPARISCPGTCEASFDRGVRVRLLATAGRSSSFAGWTGACSGRAACWVTAGSGRTATATFRPIPKQKA